MDSVLEYIQGNLDEDLSIDLLAQTACFSLFHCHRVFSGMVGESVKAYIRRLRLERAAIMLKHTFTAVTTIAFDAGLEAFQLAVAAIYSMVFTIKMTRMSQDLEIMWSVSLKQCGGLTT